MIQGQNALARMPAFAESHERGTVTAMSLTIAIEASLIKAR